MVQSIVVKFLSLNFFLLWSNTVSLVEDVHDLDSELDDVLSDLTLWDDNGDVVVKLLNDVQKLLFANTFCKELFRESSNEFIFGLSNPIQAFFEINHGVLEGAVGLEVSGFVHRQHNYEASDQAWNKLAGDSIVWQLMINNSLKLAELVMEGITGSCSTLWQEFVHGIIVVL